MTDRTDRQSFQWKSLEWLVDILLTSVALGQSTNDIKYGGARQKFGQMP